MLRGIFTGAAGMKAQQGKLDVIANNLANVNQNGFKKDLPISKAFPEILIRRSNDNGVVTIPLGSYDRMPVVGKMGTGVELNEVFTIFNQGNLVQTENDFDIALKGNGFFSIETEQGERYTRNGSFTINKDGFLVTKDGFYVLGEQGRINLKKNNFIIDEEGNIFQNLSYAQEPERLVSKQENEWESTDLLDRLKIVNFPRLRELEKQGNSFYRSTKYSGEAFILDNESRPKVVQGFLESSNVNVVKQMVQMIEINRIYEANQKIIQSHDSTLGRVISEVGLIR